MWDKYLTSDNRFTCISDRSAMPVGGKLAEIFIELWKINIVKIKVALLHVTAHSFECKYT